MGLSGPDETKERLLVAAERLFAEHGIEAVTPRQIALSAGLRNQSAIQYHFGSKDELVRALLERRVHEVNAGRRAILARLDAGARVDVRALIGAIALPLAERVARDAAGGSYIRFLAHLFADRTRRELWIRHGLETVIHRRIFRMLRERLPELPDALWDERLRLMVGAIIHGLAERERQRPARGRRDALGEAAFVENLIDAGVGILTVRPARSTLSALGEPSAERDKTDGTNG